MRNLIRALHVCMVLCSAGCEQEIPAVPSIESAGQMKAGPEELDAGYNPKHSGLPGRQPPGTFELQSNPFSAKAWMQSVETVPQTPAPVPVQQVQVATAPPLPFSYAGKMELSPGQWTYYLVRGDESFALSKGDTFDNVYRLVSADASKLVIEYLPLSEKQTLPISAE